MALPQASPDPVLEELLQLHDDWTVLAADRQRALDEITAKRNDAHRVLTAYQTGTLAAADVRVWYALMRNS